MSLCEITVFEVLALAMIFGAYGCYYYLSRPVKLREEHEP